MVPDDAATDWPQIIFETSPDQSDALEEALFAAGALSVQFQDLHDDPVLEPAPGEIRLWENIRLVGLFAQGTSTGKVHETLKIALSGAVPQHRWVALTERTWERVWMDSFKPMRFGERLWICPTHDDPPDPEAVNLRLDPGLAFGTGTHETTRQCLEWLARHDLTGKSVIDFGCGSGVLAVAAAMLGAGSVLATDIDPQALEATLVNARNNAVSDCISICRSDGQLTGSADLLMANILFQPLMQLAPRFAELTRPGGHLIMSGILVDQVEELSLRYNQWFRVTDSGRLGSWAVLEAERRLD